MKNVYRIAFNPIEHLLISLLLFLGNVLVAQQVEINTQVYSSLSACQEADTFFVSIVNETNNILNSPQVQLELPQGIEYISGSLTETSALNVQESNISNPEYPIFTCNNIPTGDSIQFQVTTRATAKSIDFLLQGNTFRNKVNINYTNGSASKNSPPYNLLYAALNITAVSPTSKALKSGETFSRTIQIVNAGYGKLAHFFITDVRGANLTLIGSDLGILNSSGDTLFLTGSDFSGIGNGDHFFDSNESVIITETLEANGCDNVTVSSTIQAHWGCDSELYSTSNSYAHVNITFNTPLLKVSTNPDFNACFGANQASQQQLTINNTGQGIAKDLTIDLFKSSGSGYDENLLSKIDSSSFQYQLNGGSYQALAVKTAFTARNDGKYACLGSGPIGRVLLDLPDLKSGESISLTWDMLHCNLNACLNEKATGWEYELDYTDGCYSQLYSKSDVGQDNNNEKMTLFTETPTDINDGDTERFTYTISSFSNELPEGDGAHYELTFTLPQGLSYSGNVNDLIFTSETTVWTPFYLNYDAVSHTVVAKYPLPAPFVIPKSEITINLTGDCSPSNVNDGSIDIALNIDYITDTTCTPTTKVPFICDYLIDVDLHCPPTGNCEGLSFLKYDIYRTSFGAPDNNQDGLADASGAIDLSRVKANRAMVGDSLEGRFFGIVGTSVNHPQWNFGYANTNIEMGMNLDAIAARIRIYDASQGIYLNCDQLGISDAISGSDKNFYFDFSTAVLSANCGGFSGFTFEQGDSIWLFSNYKVTGNIGANVQEVKATNDFYMSDVSQPVNASDKYKCGYYNDKFTLIGYEFSTVSSNYYSVTSCSKVVAQNYRLSIGDCCSNFNGGNLFPYEYRNWAHVKQAKVTIPANYTVLNSYTRQQRTKKTNATSNQTVNPISAVSHQNNTLLFNLEQYYKDFGGSIDLSDDGFQGTLYLELAPNCFVPTNTYEDISWEFTFEKNDFIGGGETPWYTSTPDKIRFTPTQLELSSSNPIIDGLEKTVRWNLNVRNTTNKTDAANSWIHIKTPSNEIEILKIIDESTGLALPLSGDVYQIDEIKKSTSKDFTIVAKYGACNVDRLWVYSGYECSGYPNSFSDFQCGYSQMELRVEPKPSGLQAIINGNTIGGTCNNIVEVTVEVASVKLANADSVKINLSLPSSNSLTYRPGSAAFKYTLNDNFNSISDPVFDGTHYAFNTVEYNVALSAFGFPGVLNLDSNKLQLKFELNLESNFKPGDFALINIQGQEVCGKPLQELYMAYDPSLKFGKNETSGLSSIAENNWGVAWIDYNNDGWEDVFVTNYETNEPNALFRNNGNGSFTKATNAGELVSDLGGSVSSTWGDYDNDGDLDVFVANNTGATNALYQNNGDGTFSKVSSSILSQYGGYCHNAAWADYDNDGFLDLFVSEYMPTRFNLLYHNNGDGTFSLISGTSITREASYSIGATWGDYDNDGDLDLFVPNTNNEPNSLYTNEGAGNFTKVTNGAIVNDSNNSVGSSWGDYNNDGYLDLFVSNSGNQANNLYRNNQDGTFTKVNTGHIVTSKGHSHGSAWGDVDNDGDLDLMVTNDQNTPNTLYINKGDGSFSIFETRINTDIANSFGTAWGDYDNDGDIDLLIANRTDQANDFYTNEKASCNAWACVKLIGTNSNRSAIGAKVRVKATIYGEDQWQLKELSSQTGGGAGSQNTLKALFGLGDATSIDSLIIEWPSGIRQHYTQLATNTCIDIQERTGSQVCGTVFHDSNNNNIKDGQEVGIANAKIMIMPGSIYTTTDQDGNYSIYLDKGSYTISQVAPENWEQNFPVSQDSVLICHDNGSGQTNTVLVARTELDQHLSHGDLFGPCDGFTANERDYQLNITVDGNTYCGINFSDTATCNAPDLSATVAATALRRGFRNTLLITYANTGNTAAYNASLGLDLDESIVPISSSIAWDNKVGTTYSWNIDTIRSGEYVTIYLVDSIAVDAPLGEFKTLSTNIQHNTNGSTLDCNTNNNQASILEEIVGSVDPNDKLVFPKGYGPAGLITKVDTLTYRIRFQNIGNYMASRVVVIDTLSNYLDHTSIHDVELSHTGTYTLLEGGVFYFYFNDIVLPDSISNEPESHGFVQFKILPREDTPEEAVILNKASIQFDYNEFIITNTVFNTVVSSIRNQKTLELHLYPNPTTTDAVAEIIAKNKQILPILINTIEIYTISGDIAKQYKVKGPQAIIYKRGLEAGIYIVKAYDASGFRYTSKLVILE